MGERERKREACARGSCEKSFSFHALNLPLSRSNETLSSAFMLPPPLHVDFVFAFVVRREKRDVRLSLLGKLGKKLELVGTCP